MGLKLSYEKVIAAGDARTSKVGSLAKPSNCNRITNIMSNAPSGVFRVILAHYFNPRKESVGIKRNSPPTTKEADRCKGNLMDSVPQREQNQPIYIGDKKVAVLRDGHLLDVRKHDGFFRYQKDHSGVMQEFVCIATETLRQARHANIIQVSNIERKIKYTISRSDFDKHSFDYETSRATGFEEQRGCYLKWFASNEPKRKNYPVHIHAESLPTIHQMGLGL